MLGEDAFLWITRLLREQTVLRRLHADGDSRQRVGQQVDKEQMHRHKRHGQCENGREQHRDDRRHVAREQEEDRVFDVAVDVSAVGDRLDDRGKVVVLQDHARRVLGDLGAGDAHCHADVGFFERRRVIYAVAGHGHDIALALPSLHDADLVLRRNARIDGDLFEHLVQLVVAHSVQLHARDGDVAVAHDADLTRDSRGGHLVVARDHDRLDAGADSVRHCLTALLTRRVDHRHQTDKGIALFGFQREGFVALLVGKREHAQALLGIAGVDIKNAFFVRFGDRTHAVFVGDADAAVEDRVERTLGEHMLHTVQTVLGGHHLAVGVKGDLLLTAENITDQVLVQADVARGLDQRVFGGVADALAVHDAGIVVEDHAVEQLTVGVVGEVKLFLADTLAVDIDFLHRHLVLRQRAGLVGADDRHAAEAFDRLQILDNGVFLCHFLGAHRLYDRDDRAERLGDRRHSQRHGVHQGADDRLALPAALPHRQHEHQHADDHNDDRQLARELVQTLLQGRFLFLGGIHQRGDLADLGVHGGLGHEHHRSAVGDKAARKDHVDAVAQRCLAADGRVGFVDICRFTGQRAFVDLQRIVVQNAAVGNHHVACFENNDIPRHNIFGVDLELLSVTDHLGGRRRERFEAVQRFFGAHMLHGSQDRVEGDDRQNDDRALKVAGEDGDDRGNDQNDDQQIRKLPQKHLQNRFFLSLCQHVFAVTVQQLLRFLA